MEEVAVRNGTKLDQLLKLAGFVSTGGEAKLVIQDGLVRINDNVETRRGHKVNNGDIVEYNGVSVKVSVQE
jgi:ribosome-associated protein